MDFRCEILNTWLSDSLMPRQNVPMSLSIKIKASHPFSWRP